MIFWVYIPFLISYMPPTYSFLKKVIHPQKSLLDLRQLILPLPAGLAHLLTNLEIFLNIRKYIHRHFPRFRWLRICPESQISNQAGILFGQLQLRICPESQISNQAGILFGQLQLRICSKLLPSGYESTLTVANTA